MKTKKTLFCYSTQYSGSVYKFVFENNEYKLQVTGDFTYHVKKYEPVYDKNGKFIKDLQVSLDVVTNKETHFIKRNLYPVQIDYKFYLFPTGFVNTIEEVQEVERIFNSSDMGVFDCEYTKVDSYSFYSGNIDDSYKRINKPTEVCLTGNTRDLYRNSFSAFLDLDFIEYKKNKESFIQTLDNEFDIAEVERIFKKNIEIAALYYQTSVDCILRNKFDRVNQSIKRLHFNINNK
jgi:hypothetical protein